MKCPNLHRNRFSQFPKEWVSYGLNKMSRSAQSHVSQLHPYEIADGNLKKMFARNCMKSADLHRKVIFGNPQPLGGVNFQKKCCLLEIE